MEIRRYILKFKNFSANITRYTMKIVLCFKKKINDNKKLKSFLNKIKTCLFCFK